MPEDQSEDEIEQHARFLKAARALGCDEDEAKFNEKLERVAKVKPKVDTNSAKKPDRGS